MSLADDLNRLARMAALKRDAESQVLVTVNGEIARLQQQVTRMRRSVAIRTRDLELDPSRMAGADVLWTRRTEQQIREVQQRIAQLHVDREAATQAAKLAYGKFMAVDAMKTRAVRQRTLRRE